MSTQQREHIFGGSFYGHRGKIPLHPQYLGPLATSQSVYVVQDDNRQIWDNCFKQAKPSTVQTAAADHLFCDCNRNPALA